MRISPTIETLIFIGFHAVYNYVTGWDNKAPCPIYLTACDNVHEVAIVTHVVSNNAIDESIQLYDDDDVVVVVVVVILLVAVAAATALTAVVVMNYVKCFV